MDANTNAQHPERPPITDGPPPPTALITGATAGLGLAIAVDLANHGWHLIITGRRPDPLAAALAQLSAVTDVTAIRGDVADADHRDHLSASASELDLLVNNASDLGPSPLPAVAELPAGDLTRLLAVNTVAPAQIFRAMRPALLRRRGAVINITSDAASGPWPGWAGYGASKAALEQLTRVLAAEERVLGVYALDPGDMRTAMHQRAFPGEDISDRPEPSTAAPAVRLLATTRPEGWRHSAAGLIAGARAEVPA